MQQNFMPLDLYVDFIKNEFTGNPIVYTLQATSCRQYVIIIHSYRTSREHDHVFESKITTPNLICGTKNTPGYQR